jgi:hypothetical protein
MKEARVKLLIPESMSNLDHFWQDELHGLLLQITVGLANRIPVYYVFQ